MTSESKSQNQTSALVFQLPGITLVGGAAIVALLVFVGTALVSGQLHALLGLVVIAFAYWRKIQLEEERLRVAFGADYDTYRRKTWALIPGLL